MIHIPKGVLRFICDTAEIMQDPIWGIGVNLKKCYCVSLYGVKLWIGLSDELKQGGGGALTRRSHPLFTHCMCVCNVYLLMCYWGYKTKSR